MMDSKKVILIIMDGWGIGDGSKSDVISNTATPFVDSLYKKYPHSWLYTSGENVGLPDGQMGNSEVGHLNLGAGRVVYQDLAKINKSISDKSINTNTVLLEAFEYVRKNKVKLHLMGLVSDGGVHSSQEHLHALCDLVKQHNLENVYVHCFTDGRDTDPKSGLNFIQKLENKLMESTIKIASVCGRYFAMDRDQRWERIKLAYEMLVHGNGERFFNAFEGVQNSYNNSVTDEFIKPFVVTDEKGNYSAQIENGDAVICFNFRTDRCREISQALTQKDFAEYEMKKLDLHFVTMTNYDDSFQNVHVLFNKDNLSMTLGEVLSKAGKSQIRIAETEKYPHVTFFFSGGREEAFLNEKRLLVPSPKVATYDLKPEMSAIEITNSLLPEIIENSADFICLNFANADMVGHTGVYSAVQKAIVTVDACVQKVVEAGIQQNYSMLIIADHGNAEYELNEDGSPNTSHTTNPVPCILINHDKEYINNGKLADIAPTVLKLMNIPQPSEMTGVSLL